jgi:hypothetical protein
MRSSCERGRSKATSVGTGEAGSAEGPENGPMLSVEVVSTELRVRLGRRIGGGVTGVEGWAAPAASRDDVPSHAGFRLVDDGPAVGWESCSDTSSWRRFPSDEEPCTELEGAKGEERGVLTTSGVVASVITTSWLEGRDGDARLSVFKRRRRRNGMTRRCLCDVYVKLLLLKRDEGDDGLTRRKDVTRSGG